MYEFNNKSNELIIEQMNLSLAICLSENMQNLLEHLAFYYPLSVRISWIVKIKIAASGLLDFFS